MDLQSGDLVRLELPGGGGYGVPDDGQAEPVREDPA